MNKYEKFKIRYYHNGRIQDWSHDKAKAQGWHSEESQQARFGVIAGLVDFDNLKVMDLGCGYGELKTYLDERFSNLTYIGIDQQKEFINYAKKRYRGAPHTSFHQLDFANCRLPEVDVVVCSGGLSYRCDEPIYYLKIIAKMYHIARNSVIFNMLDKASFDPGDYLIGHEPEKIEAFCHKLAPKVDLITGYWPKDFTVKLSKT